MMLRSSSTPVLGSLLCSFSESPNNYHHSESQTTAKQSLITTTTHYNYNKLSFNQTPSPNFTPFSCNSSPISESRNGFRRAQSEGNLQELVNSTSNVDEFSFSNPPKKFPRRLNCPILETIPSFSFHNSRRFEDDDSDEEEEEEEEEREENDDMFGTGSIRAMKSGDVNLEYKKSGFNGKIGFSDEYNTSVEFGEKGEMYLARGLGIDESVNIGFGGSSGGGGRAFFPAPFDRDRGGDGGGDGGRLGIEEHYKRMVEENPGNPLFLRNYAQYLYQSKQDLRGAEEYYSRAILVDPKDGDVLSQYAKLVWELHRDEDRATSYFEQAVHATPQDSHVQAAYASFLWDTEEDEDEDEDEDNTSNAFDEAKPFFHRETLASTA